MPSSGGGDTKTQTVTQNNSPPAYALPGLQQGATDLASNYAKGAPDYYPGQTVADFSPQQQQSIQGITDLATQGNPTLQAANQQLLSTINGNYLNSNPYFDQVASQVRQPVDSQFAAGGRYDSGQHDAAVAGALAPYAYQNYAAERQNQLNAVNAAPALDQAQYYGMGQLGQVGSAVQQQGQNTINSNISQYDYNQNKGTDWINQYLATLNGSPGGSSTTTSPIYTPSPWGNIAGAGLTAAGLLSSFLGSNGG